MGYFLFKFCVVYDISIVNIIYYAKGGEMPIIDSQKIAFARSTVEKEKVFTLNKLVSILNCSSRTAQAKLKIWNTYTSYNQKSAEKALMISREPFLQDIINPLKFGYCAYISWG